MPKQTFPAKLEHLEAMLDFILSQARFMGFSEKKISQIQLAAEEVLVNVINYAYPDKRGDIEITLNTRDGVVLEVVVVDWGFAFNPLELPEPDLCAELEDRKIGGLGIYLLRKLMDEVSYKRENDRNILAFVRRADTADMLREPCEKKKEGSSASGGAVAEKIYKWPLNYMKKEVFKKGDLLFKAGDKADKMFYVNKGAIKLVEIDKIIKAGEVIGEMGIFSPDKARTATAVCDEDLEAYTMGRDEVVKFFGQDPNLAISLIQLSIKRFIENLKAETAARERIESELRIAHDIQNSMLPQVFPPFPDRKEFDIYATMDPAKEVGGDFYDFFFVGKNKLCVVIGDVSGKGVPAALFMAISKTLLKNEAMSGFSADEVISRVNNILVPDNQLCMFVTVFLLLLDTDTGEIQFCNGGHNPPLICGKNKCFEFMDVPKGFVVGAMENIECVSKNITLDPGGIIFLYTDGVSEAMNKQQQLFSEARLRESLEKIKDKPITEIVSGMRREILNFAGGAAQSDDITVVVLRYNGRQG